MQVPMTPVDEEARLQALLSLSILDTLPEERYDRITRVAQKLFDTPIVLVSLIDSDRQWFKSRQGLEASQTPRSVSFCGHAILQDDILYIPDATNDARFVDNPLVTGPPNIRFYAGAPLEVKDGCRVGTLCIIDQEPREFSKLELQVLRDLADMVEDELRSLRLSDAVSAIHKHDNYLQAIFNNVLYGIVTLSQHGLIQSINPTAMQMFAWKQSDAINSDFHSRFIEPFGSMIEELIRQSGITGLIDSPQEATAINLHDQTFPVKVAISQAQINNTRLYVVVIEDITIKQKLESQSKEYTRALELGNEELEAFTYSASHDLRAPLRTIDGFTYALQEIIDSEEGKEHLSRIRTAAQRMNSLIDDFLRLSRLSKQELMPTLVDISELVCEIVENLKDKYPDTETSFIIAENVIDNVDKALFSIAMENLIENALKYSGEKSASEVEFGVCDREGLRTYFVRDNGIGLDMKYADKLFKPFQRLHSNKDIPGTGIGLTIAQRIIRRHGGKIWVDAEVGTGASFYFVLNIDTVM